MFKRLFAKLKRKPETAPAAPEEQRVAYNTCLFVAGSSVISTKVGVFYSSSGPGIQDCKNGILYVAPEEYMLNKIGNKPTSYAARNAVLEYYGIQYEYKTKLSYRDDLYFN